MKTLGVIHGRFQPFHNDHLRYLLAAFKKVDYLYIGITNPDPSLTLDDIADMERSQAISNPCTFYERLEMVQNCLKSLGIECDKYCVVPFPINIPSLWKYYVPRKAKHFITIYDSWGEKKLESLNQNGLNVEILWKKPVEQKGITATHIREAILYGKQWKHLVPESTVKVIEDGNIECRIKELYLAIKQFA